MVAQIAVTIKSMTVTKGTEGEIEIFAEGYSTGVASFIADTNLRANASPVPNA